MDSPHKEIKLQLTAQEARLLAYQLGFDGDAFEKQDQGDYAQFLWRISRRISDQLRTGPKPNIEEHQLSAELRKAAE